MESLDPLLHQPLRTQLAAYLAGAGEATFSEIKGRLDVSDGNLDSHMKKLVAAGYVSVRRESGDGRPQSFYSLTPMGRDALARYVKALYALLPPGAVPGIAGADDSPAVSPLAPLPLPR